MAGDRIREPLSSRLTAQLLAGPPARDPVEVAERLLAIQAQDQRGMRLAIRARTTGLTVADVDRALTDERSLVVSWLNRGTLHLVRSDDYHWLHALTAPGLFAATARRLRQEGVSEQAAERGTAAIVNALSDEGPLTRAQLRERIDAAGVRTEGQALVHLLGLASHRGLIVRGPVLARGEHAVALVRDWIGERATPDRSRSLAELARRYLAGHAPADERDLARWSGLPLRDARAGLSAVASRPNLRREREPDEPPAPRLLGPFDPVLLGWASRELVLGDHDRAVVSGGVFRAFVLVDGRAVGLWRLAGGRVVLEPFTDIADEHAAALRDEAEDVRRFLGDGS